MKTTLIILLMMFGGLLSRAEVTSAPPLVVAVLDFETTGKKLDGKGKEVALLLNAALSSGDTLLLVERADLKKVLGEQELGLSGTVNAASAAKIGYLVGARVLITGRVIEMDSVIMLAAKIISTETGRVFGVTAKADGLEGMDDACEVLGGKILAKVVEQSSNLVAEVESQEAWLKRIGGLIPDGPKPSIWVSVKEQHINNSIIDPAVETELGLTLKSLGYEVRVGGDRKKAEIAITGEAFSEFAARYGNLAACRARVEFKVKRLSDDIQLFVGRETASAADISQNVAGKQALANSARKVVERVLPVLVLE